MIMWLTLLPASPYAHMVIPYCTRIKLWHIACVALHRATVISPPDRVGKQPTRKGWKENRQNYPFGWWTGTLA